MKPKEVPTEAGIGASKKEDTGTTIGMAKTTKRIGFPHSPKTKKINHTKGQVKLPQTPWRLECGTQEASIKQKGLESLFHSQRLGVLEIKLC